MSSRHALSTFIAHFIPKDVSGQPVRRHFHIIATYTNTYNAAIHNSFYYANIQVVQKCVVI